MNQSMNTDSKNSKEPQQKYRLGTVSIKILGGLNRFYGLKAFFEMGSTSFSTKISYSFVYIRICTYDVLHKLSVLLQFSTFLLPISKMSDSKVFQNLPKL